MILVDDELDMKRKALEVANALRAARYGDAAAVFLAGSIVRGEGTKNSDLDIVVVYEHVSSASRESYLYQGWPVEVFIHDQATLKYFFKEHDLRTAVPSLATMVNEGIELSAPSEASRSCKKLAESVLSEGPMAWSENDINASRYAITNLIDDLRDPRSHIEAIATSVELHRALAQHIFRTRRLWMATGKIIPRQLERTVPLLAEEWNAGFKALFELGDVDTIVSMAYSVLEPNGGWLFEGYTQVTPTSWRHDDTV